MELTLWFIPNHMRPSFSIKALHKGAFEKPGSFRDRIYLTDVVDALWRCAQPFAGGTALSLLSHKDYFITRADIAMPGVGVEIEGHRLGLSSWSSAFRVKLMGDEPRVKGYLQKVLASLGRMPLNAPYWGQGEWDALQRQNSQDRASLVDDWKRALPGNALMGQ